MLPPTPVPRWAAGRQGSEDEARRWRDGEITGSLCDIYGVHTTQYGDGRDENFQSLRPLKREHGQTTTSSLPMRPGIGLGGKGGCGGCYLLIDS